MKTFLLVVLCLLLNSLVARASLDLGNKILFASNNDGKPAFGVQYTYGNDPGGKNYMLMFTPLLSQAERSKTMLWNFYSARSSSYLLPWDIQNATQLMIVSITVKGSSVVESILKDQGNRSSNEIYFVLADPTSQKPVYYFSISDLCRSHPSHFGDLTNGQRCDQIKNP